MEEDPFGDVMNSMRKYVVSNRLESTSAWGNSSIVQDNFAAAVRDLKSQPGKNILVDGTGVLIHSPLRGDLIDEFLLHVYALVLGTGTRLFPDEWRGELYLAEASPRPTGVVFARYQRHVS